MNAEMLWKMQGWIQMIMMIFNEEAGDLNFLPSCHDCLRTRQTRIDGRILENMDVTNNVKTKIVETKRNIRKTK